MNIDEQPVSEAYMAAVDLCLALGLRQIGDLPGAWVHRVDEHWTVAINGKPAPVDVEPSGCMKISLAPCYLAVWWNGWLAGLLTLHAGTLAAGEGANEDNLIAALEAARRAA